MECFVCRQSSSSHVIRALQSRKGPGGWGRICVPCALIYDLDGVLMSPAIKRDGVDAWANGDNKLGLDT